MIEDFIPRNGELREGAQLAGTSNVERLTPERVRSTLAQQVGQDEATRRVVEMICFDILIGNSDRHHENWGIVIPSSHGDPYVAPLYDNRSSLGSGLMPQRVQHYLMAGWEVFDRRFRYEMCDEDGMRLYVPDLLNMALRWDPSLARLGAKFLELNDDIIGALVAEAPAGVVSDAQRWFASSLLAHRRDLILASIR